MDSSKPTKIYAEVLEDTALEQFKSAMEQPFSVKGALMPDAHTGYSLPIGAVIATKDMVLPSWVGYDIGCGMCAIKLNDLKKADIENHTEEIFKLIYEYIPVGFNINQSRTTYDINGLTEVGQEIAFKKKYEKALCSLGGGNHFIEVGYDSWESIWIVIHSGSRGVGHGIATHYMKEAHPDGKAKEGHYGFHTDSQMGQEYIQDLNWCLDYALFNRRLMIERVAKAIYRVLGITWVYPNFDKDLINRNHNHAVKKDGLWIHRKGATHAEEGMYGVIPGNMRDGSFIVKGRGNPDSLYSSSHGAGRVLGRKEAKRQLKLEDFENTMSSITAKIEESTIDESPFAYKNIFDVMRLQEDLVEIIEYIKPLINIKG